MQFLMTIGYCDYYRNKNDVYRLYNGSLTFAMSYARWMERLRLIEAEQERVLHL